MAAIPKIKKSHGRLYPFHLICQIVTFIDILNKNHFKGIRRFVKWEIFGGKYNRGYIPASPFPARESQRYDVLIEKLKKYTGCRVPRL